MATLIFIRNPLSQQRDARHFDVPAGSRPIDWLLQHYPPERGGAGGPVLHWHNGERIAGDDDDYLDRPILEGDRAILMVPPAGIEISLGVILITALVTAVVSAAVSLGLALLFPEPGVPAAAVPGGQNAASPVYNVRSRQNIARLGEPVPVVYGRVLMTPDLCSQPYGQFEAGTRGMFVDTLMCLGQGYFDVDDVIVGETSASRIEGGAAQYIVVPPDVHGGEFGHLAAVALANGWAEGFVENAWTSTEVGEQRFTHDGDGSGFFRVGRAGVSIGQTLTILIEFPRGLYQMPDWGQPIGTNVNFDVYVDEADADGNPVPGTRQEFNYTLHGAEIDPRRDQININLGRSASWLVKLYRRTVQYPNGDEMNEFYWRGLMLHCGHNQVAAYGNVTLLMVRMRAEQVASTAEWLIRVSMIRKLPDAGMGDHVATASPAEAFINVYTDGVYGARRPLAELDHARIMALKTYWSGYEFNAVYTQRTTVWEALAQTVQGVAAAPLPVAGAMSITQDGVRPVRSMMFTEQNITRGSFSLAYHFEATGAPDGIEIAYVDPATWSPAYVRYPAGSLAPDRLTLFGCSNATHAAQFARLQWQRRQRLRRLVEFSTELEGLIPNPGERIAVAHTLPRWGVSGLVAAVEAPGGVNITLDRALPWEEVLPPWYMMFRDEYSGASAIVQATPGSAANQVQLATYPWGPGQDWRLAPTAERTHFTWGDGERVVKDFTLTALAPKGGKTVAATGVVYDPAVYELTLSFLSSPVP